MWQDAFGLTNNPLKSERGLHSDEKLEKSSCASPSRLGFDCPTMENLVMSGQLKFGAVDGNSAATLETLGLGHFRQLFVAYAIGMGISIMAFLGENTVTGLGRLCFGFTVMSTVHHNIIL